jgi:hypothetical protein
VKRPRWAPAGPWHAAGAGAVSAGLRGCPRQRVTLARPAGTWLQPRAACRHLQSVHACARRSPGRPRARGASSTQPLRPGAQRTGLSALLIFLLIEPRRRRGRVFLNPSTSDVVATTSAEALAMGKWLLCPAHASNAFFAAFANCLAYRSPAEFAAQLRLAEARARGVGYGGAGYRVGQARPRLAPSPRPQRQGTASGPLAAGRRCAARALCCHAADLSVPGCSMGGSRALPCLYERPHARDPSAQQTR